MATTFHISHSIASSLRYSIYLQLSSLVSRFPPPCPHSGSRSRKDIVCFLFLPVCGQPGWSEPKEASMLAIDMVVVNGLYDIAH